MFFVFFFFTFFHFPIFLQSSYVCFNDKNLLIYIYIYFKSLNQGVKKYKSQQALLVNLNLLMLSSLAYFPHSSLIQMLSLGCGIGPGFTSFPENACSKMTCMFQGRK